MGCLSGRGSEESSSGGGAHLGKTLKESGGAMCTAGASALLAESTARAKLWGSKLVGMCGDWQEGLQEGVGARVR